MKFDRKYAGKWVAIKRNQVVASDSTFEKLDKKIEKLKNKESLRYALIPKGLFAGSLWFFPTLNF